VNWPALYLGLGAVASGTAVALGAFGAHALRGRLDAAALATWQTAVQYQFFHGLALCVVALWLRAAVADEPALPRLAAIAAGAFCAGILLFSGSLYGLVLGGPRWLGPVTPIGGLALIGGWLCLGYDGIRRSLAN
jgi:uncharacterized membrane protein YgdD (TMEM256/DUF423 family)